MSRRDRLNHQYVEFIPKVLDEGVLYISKRFNTSSHLCCCGCGFKVVTPLNPAKWRLIDHGQTVSLSPSVGLGALPCRSHYWIDRGQVDWYPEMTARQTQRAQRRDEFASQIYTGERKSMPPRKPTGEPRPAPTNLLKRFRSWLRSLWM